MATSFYDHPIAMAGESVDYKASTLDRIGNAFTLGAPAAVASGLISIANTGLDIAGEENIDTSAFLNKFDNEIGSYYDENKTAVDIGGFVAGALLPSSLAVKGVQMLRAGNATNSFGRALNFAASRKDAYMKEAFVQMGKDSGNVRSLLNSSARRKALGWDVVDNAGLGLAAEIAIVGTMYNNPVFDGDTFKDYAWNMALGTVLSGGIGGILGSVAAKGLLLEGGKEVQKVLRSADTVYLPEKEGLMAGTEAMVALESILKLSDNVKSVTVNTDRAGGKLVLDIGSEVEAAKLSATRTATDKLALVFNRLAEGDALVGQAYLRTILEGVDSAKAAGKDATEIASIVNGYLANVKFAGSIDLDKFAMDARKFYVTREPVGDTAIDKLKDMFSLRRSDKTLRTPYMLADDATQDSLVFGKFTEGKQTIKQYFKENPGVDLVQLDNGSFRVNPKSARVKKVANEPNEVSMYVHLPTGTVSPEALPVFADTLRGKNFSATADSIAGGGRTYKQAGEVPFNIKQSPLEASARWVWASQLSLRELLKLNGGVINAADFPVLKRFQELYRTANDIEQRMLQKAVIRTRQGGDIPLDEVNLSNDFVAAQMRTEVMEQLDNLKYETDVVPSSHAIAAQLNTSIDWVEETIAQGFNGTKYSDKARLFGTADALRPQNARVTWDFKSVAGRMTPEAAYEMNMGPAHLVTKELTKEYQHMVRDFVGTTAQNQALGPDAAGFMPAPKNLSADADVTGAGAGTFTASNASYGERAKLWVQETGKQVGLVTQKWQDATIGAMTPYLNAIKDNQRASAEWGILTNSLRLNPNKLIFDLEDITGSPTALISRELYQAIKGGTADSVEEFIERAVAAGQKAEHHLLKVQSDEVYDFMRAHAEINAKRQDKFKMIWNAMGLPRKDQPGLVAYVPPIDTVRRPYIAFVKTKPQMGLADDVGMITARTEDELRTLAAEVGDDFDVFYKQDTENYFKAKSQYEYGMTLNESRVDSALASRGKLGAFQPETRYENIAADYLNWHARQEESLVRAAVQVGNREFFSEMKFLSDQYRKVSESQAKGFGSTLRRKIEDPFGDYIKTALNTSKQSEFPLLDSLNEFVDKVGIEAGRAYEKAFRDAKEGVIDWKEAQKILERYGHKGVYTDVSYYEANTGYAKNLVRGVVQRVNSLLAGTTLRLDFMHSLVNIISTPIMLGTEVASIKRLIANDSELAGKLNELMTVPVPGTNGATRVPSTTKLIYQASQNFFGKDKEALFKRYQDMGAIKDTARLYFEMLDDLAFRPNSSAATWLDRVDKGIDKAAKFTGNTFSEEFTRFVSADVMRQISQPLVDAGKMTVREQNAYIGTFVNRAQGNYVSSQRPVLFQGTTGAAIGLFQTYAFNVLQQLHRHVAAGDKKTLAIFAGLQGSMFGMNGLPFFDAINTHLIGNMVANNPNHQDAYSVLPGINKELGDWMLYGTASAFPIFTDHMPALYSRGDINPRHISIVPINPADIPAVQASLKLVDAVIGFGKNVMNGVDLSDAMLHGLQHQGWNRPLAGFAQTLAGRSTTSNGTLISASSDMAVTSALGMLQERMVDFGGVSRMLGARPMDEAVALQQLYRMKGYRAMDRARIERLGSVVKTKLYDGEVPTDEEYEDFMLRYARSGGRIENFQGAMQRWMRDANVSVLNQMAQKNGNGYPTTLRIIMGGEEVMDYRNTAE